MTYTTGSKLVYPSHGPATVTTTERINLNDDIRDYLVLETVTGNLTIRVPVDRVEDLGIRDLIDPADVPDLLDFIGDIGAIKESTNWSRRFKVYQDRVKSGDVYDVAEVVRNIGVRNLKKPVSHAERNLFANARSILFTELSFTLDVPIQQIENQIDALIEGEPAAAA